MSAPAIDDQPRDNSLSVPTIGRGLYFAGGVMLFINGMVFLGSTFVTIGQCNTQTNTCVGPGLFWSPYSFVGGFGDAQNVNWRFIFPLNPVLFCRNWTGIVLGMIMMMVHLPGFKFMFCTRTWLHVCLFVVFCVLFGAFPYSGNLGILVGFFNLPLIFLSLAMAFIPQFRSTPTTFLLQLNVNQERFSYLACLAENVRFITVVRWFSAFLGFLVFVVGLIHVFVTDFYWCPNATFSQCAGPSLRWNSPSANNSAGTGFTYDANDESGWRSVFTFQIDIFCSLWGPTILGYITILQHIRDHTWPILSLTWARVMLWFFFLAFFAAFGYAGNFGILVGFLCILMSFLALLITLSGGGKEKTHLEWELPIAVIKRTVQDEA